MWAEIDQTERRLAKAYFDAVGPYARWDPMQLVLRLKAIVAKLGS